MQSVRVLPEGLRNKIAAGEVVERPASVVKELVENAIDAGSTAIEVEVAVGGRKLIKVADDGRGMDREDALLSLERHATSKLGREEDLFNIRTMGFRGEALPAIASVSKFLMNTVPRGAASGVSIEVTGGRVGEVRESPGRGTSVEVRDLFFNTPARKKFLKKDSTELMHVIDTLTRLALSHPGIGFALRADGQETMRLPKASGLRERLMQVYGAEFLDGLLECGGEAGGVKLRGFIARPENVRQSRAHQMVFINRRPVREPSVSHAVYSAYEGMIPRDTHPPFFIFMEVDPARVDVNVHPTKREVRFEDKEAIHRFLRKTVMDAVRAGLSGAREAFRGEAAASRGSTESFTERPVPSAREVLESLPIQYRAEPDFIYLGDTFIALSGKALQGGALSGGGGLTLIDHHAAHERVLYERLLRGVKLASHQLLVPRQVRLSPREYMVILEHRAMLSEFGIEVEDFGHDTVLVRALPEAMREADLRGILSDSAAELMEGARPGESLREAVAARIACHSSIRGSVMLDRQRLSALLRDLEETERPEQCPHGRPTRVFYSLDELKRIFKRK
jgi:DNA mismatch repair protein MutL